MVAEIDVPVYCYWNGCIKYGCDGVYYEGPIPTLIIVKRKTELNQLLDKLYRITGSKVKVFGRYPLIDRKSNLKYLLLPVVDDNSLDTLLELQSNHPCMDIVEFYLELKSDGVIVDGLKKSHGVIASSKPRSLSSLWVDDHELRVGLCFKDRDELKKAVDWCSIRGKQKCVVRETTGKDEFTFECVRRKCNWSLRAVRVEEHGLVEITEFSGSHTCFPIGPDNFEVEFAAEEIECLIRVQPTLTVDELRDWWFEKFGNGIGISEMQKAKEEVIKKVYGDWDHSFRVLPKLMAALQESNGVIVDWQYKLFPNPEFASFRGVFWAFPQSVEGFRHCRPLIIVDSKDLDGKYPMKLMIASGVEADGLYFPLAFAVTKEVSVDSWRWFLTGIRKKVTQRKGLCLISSPHPDICAVINEPGSMWQEPWAHHRFCLDRLITMFLDVFQDDDLDILVLEAGLTKQQGEFDCFMETIKKEKPEAWQLLDQIPPHKWALAHDNGRRYGMVQIFREDLFEICESFHSLGDLPITAAILLLFDELRLFFNSGLCDSNGRLNHGDMYTKTVMVKLEKLRKASSESNHVITPLDKGLFQVTEPSKKDGWIVELSKCSCTCGKFQWKKIPCLHALAVCEKLKINPLQYVDDCYSLERLSKTYAATFNPVPQVSAWPEACGVPTLLPPPFPSKAADKSQH